MIRSQWLAAALLAVGMPGFAPACAQEEQRMATAPDFSAVTTRAAAERLVREGKLVRIHFFPTELGGPDDPENIGYITPEAADARRRVIGTLRRLTDKGEVRRMEVTPDYRGDSFVPTRITLTASGGTRGGSIEMAIEVW